MFRQECRNCKYKVRSYHEDPDGIPNSEECEVCPECGGEIEQLVVNPEVMKFVRHLRICFVLFLIVLSSAIVVLILAG